MEHTRITPPAGAEQLPPDMLDTLAHHGLRELLFAPIPKVARALAGFDRDQLGTAIEVMIAMLDAADGDTDAEVEDRAGETIAIMADPDIPPPEDEGDPDLEETGAEDSFVTHYGSGPGCPISDPVEHVGDEHDTNNAEDELTAGVPPGFGGRGAGCSLSDGDGDRAYAEWHSLPAATRRSGAIDGKPFNDWGQGVHEDAEEDDGDTGVEDGPKGFDPEEDMCSAGDDRVFSGPVTRGGPVDGCDYPGSEDDAEGEQMFGDVPMPPVFSLDHNIFNDKRQYVGHSNLMTSFQANGSNFWSADTGNPHTRNGDITKPGVPV
jgi:hypothetical protein